MHEDNDKERLSKADAALMGFCIFGNSGRFSIIRRISCVMFLRYVTGFANNENVAMDAKSSGGAVCPEEKARSGAANEW